MLMGRAVCVGGLGEEWGSGGGGWGACPLRVYFVLICFS